MPPHEAAALRRRREACQPAITALRAPDSFTAQRQIGPNGAHHPATLYALAQRAEKDETGGSTNLYARISNRLSQLVESVGGPGRR